MHEGMPVATGGAGNGSFESEAGGSIPGLSGQGRQRPFGARSEAEWTHFGGVARGAARHWTPASGLDDVVQDTLIELLGVESVVQDEDAFVSEVARNCARRQYRAIARWPMLLVDEVLAGLVAREAPPVTSATTREWFTEVALPCLRGGPPGRGRASVGTPLEIRVVTAFAQGATGYAAIAGDLGSSAFSVRRAARTALARIRSLDVPPPHT